MTDQIPAEAIEAAARAIQSAHVPVTGEAVPGWESESEAWRKTYRDFARAALEAVDPFLRPEPSEGFATCETCDVTFTGTGTGDRFEVEHVGDRKHRVRALIRVPGPSEDDGSTWEQVRWDRGWPTPNAMRRAATGIDELAIPKYGDVLRFVADLCDDPGIPVGFTRRPMPSREEVAKAIARGLDGWNDFDDASADYQNELLSGADAVLALFATPGGDS